MKDSKDLRVEVKQADEKVLELIQLISLIKQTGREKYEILNPVADNAPTANGNAMGRKNEAKGGGGESDACHVKNGYGCIYVID